MLIDIIAGARPNFMKIAPIIEELRAIKAKGVNVDYRLVHTGQHYDRAMSGNFFEQLGIPHPDINLEVGSGTQAQQTARIMERYESVLLENPAHLCMVVGDVTSTMACSIAAKKLNISVAHVEGGIRSGDMTMPEEVNRMVTDSITDYFFTTSETANANLRKSGVADNRIFFVGNTMIDTLLKNMSRLEKPEIWGKEKLQSQKYYTLTLHRPANVDDEKSLKGLIEEISKGAEELPVIFPVHPRTAKNLEKIGVDYPNIIMTEPMGYLQFIYLVKNTRAVITDSGGITEEATVLGVPCMTLRDSTERPETVTVGTNELLGIKPEAVGPAFERLKRGEWKKGEIPELWDGKTAQRIVEHILNLYNLY
ncbi:MAG: UDP-N-acetylglucosamine 2-epimerase (non-hydrolyzing) [Cyclobacteriaceae bacterium]|nr:UDP-N-acetylglucosamine 2-epimerase (non-hydrolyzing) [Cyclobacteriaceae bacterium]